MDIITDSSRLVTRARVFAEAFFDDSKVGLVRVEDGGEVGIVRVSSGEVLRNEREK